jgi:1-acyl-sn-glycerol-3-phosphate acyltransferase
LASKVKGVVRNHGVERRGVRDPNTALYPYQARLPALLYWPYRALRTVLTASCFAGFWSGAVVAAWIVMPILGLWPGTSAQKTKRALGAMRIGFRVFHTTMHALRLYRRISPVKALRPGASPVVLVANHPTLCDVTSIVSLFPNVVAVARPSFAANRLIRRAVRLSGFVPTGPHVLRDAMERLRMGLDVLVFPEGTRTHRDGTLRPFHRGAFELAVRANVPLVLLKLTCAPPALSKGLPIWRVCDKMATLTIEPFAVIEPGPGLADSKQLCQEIEQRYRALIGYPPAAETSSDPATSRDQTAHR